MLMLFGEPQRTSYDLNFSMFGIPVRVHPVFWLITLMLGYDLGDVASVLTWVLAVFVAILVHELGHALVMRIYGFEPWIVLYGLGGQTAYEPGYRVHPRGQGTLAQVLISVAGPMAGFLLAGLVLLGLYWADQRHVSLNSNVLRLFYFIFSVGVVWGVVNLFPIYPLDGGQIARELLSRLNSHHGVGWSLWLSIATAVGLALVGLLWERNWFIALMFGYLAYINYTVLQAYRRGW
ncbi:MAG: site-2 protease family protein [Thermoguttaceae bacterium]